MAPGEYLNNSFGEKKCFDDPLFFSKFNFERKPIAPKNYWVAFHHLGNQVIVCRYPLEHNGSGKDNPKGLD